MRVRRYLDTDVLTAARERIHHIAETHDLLVVMFSGGKDSLATLHLTREVLAERGISTVDVVFRDEELIPDEVIDFVAEHRSLPWCRLHWFAVPLQSSKFILGRVIEYVQWDPARGPDRWLRQPPPWSILPEPGDTGALSQVTADAYIARRCGFKGKVAYLTGIRAAESLMRFRASVNKLNDSYINASSQPGISLCKPLYDWEENDVLKFFMDRGIRYCPIYDAQHLAGRALRVSTPLHAEAAKAIGKVREVSPDFYNRVMRLFPEMLTQERYWKDLDRKALQERYGESFAGIRTYIEEHFTGDQLDKALARLDGIEGRERRQPGSYPTRHVFTYFVTGVFKRELLPVSRKASAR